MLIYGTVIVGNPMSATGHYGVACVGAPDKQTGEHGMTIALTNKPV